MSNVFDVDGEVVNVPVSIDELRNLIALLSATRSTFDTLALTAMQNSNNDVAVGYTDLADSANSLYIKFSTFARIGEPINARKH